MTTDPNWRFERGFLRNYRKKQAASKLRFVLSIVALVVLVAGSVWLGWAWGYNSRLVEECTARGGIWKAGVQVCQAYSGEILIGP